MAESNRVGGVFVCESVGSLACDLPVPVVPKARPRVDRRGTHMPERYRRCLRDLGLALVSAVHRVGAWPTSARYHVELEVGVGPHGGDVDNLLGTVLDAGNGVVWDDDRQVVSATVRKFRSDNPGVHGRVVVVLLRAEGVGKGGRPGREAGATEADSGSGQAQGMGDLADAF